MCFKIRSVKEVLLESLKTWQNYMNNLDMYNNKIVLINWTV